MTKILVAVQSFSEYSDIPMTLLKNSGAVIQQNVLGHRLNREELIWLGGGCEAIIAGVEPYDQDVLKNLPGLECISRVGVGMDNIDLNYANANGITVLTTPDAVIEPVVEMTVAMAFALLRHLLYHTSIIKSGKWEKKAGHIVSGRKVGIIGTGRVGKKVAEAFRFFGADVIGHDLFPDEEWADKHGVRYVDLTTLLKTSDIISIHISITLENEFILGEWGLSLMKQGAIVINTSRGQVIDELALYQHLESGHLGGAGLDVFSEEPYTGILCKLDNVILTPHVSTLTVESRTEMERKAVINALLYLILRRT